MKIVIILVAVLIALALVAVVALSFGLGFGLDSYHVVNFDSYGLSLNKYTGAVDETQVYEPGRYATGIAHDFITMPRMFKQIDFSKINGNAVSAVTRDGIILQLDVSFQYRFEKHQVIRAFQLFGTNYDTVIVKMARNVIRDVASLYNMTAFVVNRIGISSAMTSDMHLKMNETASTTVFDVQLRNIDFPEAIDTSFQRIQEINLALELAHEQRKKELYDAETARQKDLFTLESNRQKELYALETERQKNVQQSDIKLLLAQRQLAIDLQVAQNNAAVISVTASATANATETKNRAHVQVLEYARTRLSLFNATELLTYVYLNNLRDMNTTSNYISTQPPLTLQVLKP